MPAQLVALTDGQNILLDKPILLIGRHPECDYQIESRKVSRRHCCIAQVHDYLVVRDLGSTNGIRINGTRVLEGKLKGGDELTIGNNRFQVRWDEEAPESPPVASRAEPRPPAAKGTARPAIAVLPLPDDALESCDDPVPLPDPVAPKPTEAGNRNADLPLEQATEEPGSLILPDHLELAPASGIQPPPTPPSSPV